MFEDSVWWKGLRAFLMLTAIIVVIGFFLLPSLAHRHFEGHRATCPNNLKQFGLICKMYANEDPNHLYPPLTRYDGLLMVDLQSIYPEYLSDLSIFVCPVSKEREKFDQLIHEDPKNWRAITHEVARQYVYLGWTARDTEDLQLLLEQRQMSPANNAVPTVDGEDQSLKVLREGVEKFYITDVNNPAATAKAQAEIPIMFDNLVAATHPKRAANVLYMDGHVEGVSFGNKFPVTQEVLDLLTATRGK